MQQPQKLVARQLGSARLIGGQAEQGFKRLCGLRLQCSTQHAGQRTNRVDTGGHTLVHTLVQLMEVLPHRNHHHEHPNISPVLVSATQGLEPTMAQAHKGCSPQRHKPRTTQPCETAAVTTASITCAGGFFLPTPSILSRNNRWNGPCGAHTLQYSSRNFRATWTRQRGRGMTGLGNGGDAEGCSDLTRVRAFWPARGLVAAMRPPHGTSAMRCKSCVAIWGTDTPESPRQRCYTKQRECDTTVQLETRWVEAGAGPAATLSSAQERKEIWMPPPQAA